MGVDLPIAQMIAVALERRAIADGKQWTWRGPVHPLAATARSAQVDADRLLWERPRRVRGGALILGIAYLPRPTVR